jgi:hypothetical protein
MSFPLVQIFFLLNLDKLYINQMMGFQILKIGIFFFFFFSLDGQ